MLAAGALAGCTDTGKDAAGQPAQSGAHWPPPVGSGPVPSAPAPSSTPPCAPDQGWTAEQQADWTRGYASASLAGMFAGAGVGTTSPTLCRPIPVQVEYWLVTVRSGLATLTSVLRQTVNADGGTDVSVPVPDRVSSRGPCAGAMVAVYTGATPLADYEIPRTLSLLGVKSGEGFSKRVAAQAYVGPAQTSNCAGTG